MLWYYEKCHSATLKGLVICKECKTNYHRVENGKCYQCKTGKKWVDRNKGIEEAWENWCDDDDWDVGTDLNILKRRSSVKMNKDELKRELVQANGYDLKGDYLKNVYYDQQNDTYVLIYKDKNRQLHKWFPRSLTIGGWDKDKENPQNIHVKWIPPNNYYWEYPLELEEPSRLLDEYKENFVSLYGIGSYFDENKPEDWISNDIDFTAVVENFDNIPEDKNTSSRHKRMTIEGKEVFIAFHTIETLNSKELFNSVSFANYEWALHEIKLPENSKLLYGQDIRKEIPELNELSHDYEDILRRVFYHMEKSYKMERKKDENKSKREFTKSIFKFCYYLSVLFDPGFQYTSSVKSALKVKELSEQGKIGEKMPDFIEKSILFRCKNVFIEDFNKVREDFLDYLFSIAKSGVLHRRLGYQDLLKYFKDTYEGLNHLVAKLELRES